MSVFHYGVASLDDEGFLGLFFLHTFYFSLYINNRVHSQMVRHKASYEMKYDTNSIVHLIGCEKKEKSIASVMRSRTGRVCNNHLSIVGEYEVRLKSGPLLYLAQSSSHKLPHPIYSCQNMSLNYILCQYQI